MFYHLRILASTFCISLIINSELIAQSDPYVDHIGSEDGLTSQLCQFLVEDDLGNLWISSFQDIQKYNGYDVTTFPINKFSDIDGVHNLEKDRSGHIWIVQGRGRSNGLVNNYLINIIDPITDKTETFEEYTNSSLLALENIADINFRDSTIYLTSKSDSIYTYTDKLSYCCQLESASDLIAITNTHKIAYRHNNSINIHNLNGELSSSIADTTIAKFSTFITADSGKLFFLQEKNDTVSVFEYKEGVISILINLPRSNFIANNLRFTSIEKYPDGSLLLDHRLYFKNDTTYKVFEDSNGNNNSIYDVQIGQTGLMFLSTNLGVYVLCNEKSQFNKLGQSNSQTLNSVRGILVNDRIEAYRINSEKEIIKSKSRSLNLSFLENRNLGNLASMHYIDPLNENHLWTVGYIRTHLRKIDLKNKTIDSFLFNDSPFLVNNIHRSSSTNKLYLASISGLYLFNEVSNDFLKIELDCIKQSKLSINQILESSGKLLLASSLGVIIYDEKTNSSKLTEIRVDSTKYGVQFIHIDNNSEDILWIGIQKGGLIKWNKTSNTFKVFNTSSGLSNNDVHAIIEDKNERLWISTNRHLNCLDKSSGNILIFTEQDGIAHSEFNRFGYYYDSLENNIYFGGLNGYTYFNPDSINTEASTSKINLRVLDAVKTKNNASIENIYLTTQKANSIEFNEDDVSLLVYLSTNHLEDTKNNQYSYRIPGLIEEWITQSSNEIKLGRLPYGDYNVEFIANLKKPSYTSSILSLDLKVIQPFTKTWTFYILSALGFIFLLWFASNKYFENIKARNRKLEELIGERTKELTQANRTKNKIFTILAHDLKNPISSLTSLTEKINFLSRHNRLDELSMLAESTKKRINALDDNLNNLLLWALSENNLLQLYPDNYSIQLEIKKLLSLFSSQIEEKNLTVDSKLIDIDQAYIDVTVLQTILRNFLSNAIKFSYPGENIIIKKKYEDKYRILISIRDFGIGISLGDHSDTKARDIKNMGKGSGIGLHICKELANISGVAITVNSDNIQGTEIILDLPRKNIS